MAATAKLADFTKTKDGGGQFSKKRMPSGDYLAKVVKVEDAVAKGDGEFQYLFTIQLANKSNATYPYYCKLVESQLWKLRNLLIAGGINVPKKRVKVDPNRVVGKMIGVSLEDDEYDGREQSTIERVFPAADLSDDQDDDADDAGGEDEEETGTDEPDEVEDEEEAAPDPVDAMDRTELKQAIKALDDAATFKKSETDDDLRARLREAQAAETPDLSDLDEADDEDEDEEPAPPPKKAAAKKTAAKKATPKAADEDIEDLDLDDLD